MPLHLERKTAELTQESHVEPDIGDVKAEKMALHQADEIVCRKIPARARKIERDHSSGDAVEAHLRAIGKHNSRLRDDGGGRGCALDHLGVQAIVRGGEQHEVAADEVETGIARGIDPAIFAMTMS